MRSHEQTEVACYSLSTSLFAILADRRKPPAQRYEDFRTRVKDILDERKNQLSKIKPEQYYSLPTLDVTEQNEEPLYKELKTGDTPLIFAARMLFKAPTHIIKIAEQKPIFISLKEYLTEIKFYAQCIEFLIDKHADFRITDREKISIFSIFLSGIERLAIFHNCSLLLEKSKLYLPLEAWQDFWLEVKKIFVNKIKLFLYHRLKYDNLQELILSLNRIFSYECSTPIDFRPMLDMQLSLISLVLRYGAIPNTDNRRFLKTILRTKEAYFPDPADVFFCLGILAEQEQPRQLSEALAYFEKANQCEHPHAERYIAANLRKQGEEKEQAEDYPTAMALYKQALERGDQKALDLEANLQSYLTAKIRGQNPYLEQLRDGFWSKVNEAKELGLSFFAAPRRPINPAPPEGIPTQLQEIIADNELNTEAHRP